METTPHTIPEAHLIWEPPSRDIAILLNLDVINRLQQVLSEAGEREVGAVLLGRRERDDPSQRRRIVVVDDFEIVESEHLRGAAFSVSQRDMKELGQILGRPRDPAVDQPVGIFRSHLRKGLYLDEADFSLFREYFSGNSDIFLLARPEPDGIAAAGFFYWEDGRLERRSPYQQFPLDVRSLEEGAYPIVRGSKRRSVPKPVEPFDLPVVESATLIESAVPVDTAVPVAETPEPPPLEPPPTFAVAPRSLETPPLPATKIPRRFSTDAPLNERLIYGTIGAVLIVASIISAGIMRFGGERIEQPAAPNVTTISLSVQKSGDGLHVSWDPNSPLVRNANNAILWISDGDKRRGLELNADRLKQGTYAYAPESSEVTFRLDLLKVIAQGSESVHYIADRGAAPPPSHNAFGPNVVVPNDAKNSQPPADGAGKPRLQPVVSITTQPVPPSRVKNWLAKVPLVRSLQKNRRDAFIPPRTVREIMPHVPARLARDLPPETRVDLKVSLDGNGVVREIDLLTANADDRLAKVAADAIRQWRFEPARFKDKRIPCDLLATMNIKNPSAASFTAQSE